jgi:hypothetical protein
MSPLSDEVFFNLLPAGVFLLKDESLCLAEDARALRRDVHHSGK